MRPSLLLGISAFHLFGGADAFGSRPVFSRPRSRDWGIKASASRQQAPWLAELMAEWFKIPAPNTSSAKAKRSMGAADVRASIQELRDSNAALRAEVVALRAYMQRRGFTPVDDIFAEASVRPSTAAPTVPPPADLPAPQPTSSTPPPVLPREARLVALALLWAAAVTAGGVFIPIAIGEGAANTWRWLDDGGAVMPTQLRRFLPRGVLRRPRRLGWGDVALNYLPARARAAAGPEGGGEEGGAVSADGLAAAWDEMRPRRVVQRENVTH